MYFANLACTYFCRPLVENKCLFLRVFIQGAERGGGGGGGGLGAQYN